ncbi:MAG: hypothetical protein SGPRY_013485 [Prymnesium sp.]
MAMRSMLPSRLSHEYGREETPVPALFFSCFCINFFVLLPFQAAPPLFELIELDMALYTLSLGLELVAFLRLRWSEPNLVRPFRVPLGRCGLVPSLSALLQVVEKE